jgi:hypothetical protein
MGLIWGRIAVMLENVIAAQEQMRVEMQDGFRQVRGEVNEIRGGLGALDRIWTSRPPSKLDFIESTPPYDRA